MFYCSLMTSRCYVSSYTQLRPPFLPKAQPNQIKETRMSQSSWVIEQFPSRVDDVKTLRSYDSNVTSRS